MAPGATKYEELIREEKKIGAFAAGAWTVTLQAPLSMEFSRQEYWSGLPFPSPGELPNPGTETTPLVTYALAGGFFTTVPPGKPL